jgi:hypothetical protein
MLDAVSDATVASEAKSWASSRSAAGSSGMRQP